MYKCKVYVNSLLLWLTDPRKVLFLWDFNWEMTMNDHIFQQQLHEFNYQHTLEQKELDRQQEIFDKTRDLIFIALVFMFFW